ncbi:Ephrin type-A receptor 4A [Entamoeba marina]
MSSKGNSNSRESSNSSTGDVAIDEHLELVPPIHKLTFGSSYAIQGMAMTETFTLKNKGDDTLKISVTPSTSNKYTLSTSVDNFVIKKREEAQLTVTLKFSHYASMGLTGHVQLHIKKKSFMGGDVGILTLRFQLQGMVQSFHQKDLVKTSDEEQFRIGMVNGVLSMVRNESVVAFHYDKKDDFQMQEFEEVKRAYRDIHHQSILGMAGIIHETCTLLLDGDTVCDLATLLEKEKLSTLFKLQCCVDAANALLYLSSNNMIHRNVKPTKLRVVHHDITNEGKCTVKLHDMTTVYQLKKGELIKKSPGTYEYMAPEVMEMKEHGLPIDTYSFGMTVYHIFNPVNPYKDMTGLQIQDFIISGKRPAFQAECPDVIRPIIESCMAGDPNKRPSFSKIVQRLSGIMKDYSA